MSSLNFSHTLIGRLMNILLMLALPISLLGIPMTAAADPWKDESGHSSRRHYDSREYVELNGYDDRRANRGGGNKEEYWDGNCKVERKYEKNGEYKEERKCKVPRHGQYDRPTVYVPLPPPVYAPAPPRSYVPDLHPESDERRRGFPGAVPDPYLQ